MNNEQSYNRSGDERINPGNQDGSNRIKDPDEWKTGDEPMTGAQSSYLQTLASEAGEKVDENLTKAEASKKIDELRSKSGRLEGEGGESQSDRRDNNEEQGLRGGASSV